MIATLVLLAFQFMGLGTHISRHGEKNKLKYNGWNKLIAIIIIFTLYYYAGLFDVFK